MPCVCRFYGIAVYLYAGDHHPPHFHAKYAGQDVAIDIRTLEVVVGGLPDRALSLVQEWAMQHRTELLNGWNRVQAGSLPMKIEPLS